MDGVYAGCSSANFDLSSPLRTKCKDTELICHSMQFWDNFVWQYIARCGLIFVDKFNIIFILILRSSVQAGGDQEPFLTLIQAKKKRLQTYPHYAGLVVSKDETVSNTGECCRDIDEESVDYAVTCQPLPSATQRERDTQEGAIGSMIISNSEYL